VSASYHGAFEGLEPAKDWKLSYPVLRGRRAGNSPLLPDPELLILVRSSILLVIVGSYAHNVGFYTRNPVNSGVILLKTGLK